MEPIKLFGMAGSLYTAKVRCYLRHQGLAYREIPVGDPDFGQRIVPAVGRFIMPVIEMPDGTIVQDGTDIIDFLEKSFDVPCSAYPSSALGRVVAHLFELFGGEGLLRPAMHFRWNFDDDNLTFLREDFCSGLAPGADFETMKKVFSRSSGAMRGAGQRFGVTPDTIALIEDQYLVFLDLLSDHLAAMPYLLGKGPSLGDYGFVGPLYAHLGRDPHPAELMKRIAPTVFRWTERMNAPEDYGFGYRAEAMSSDLEPVIPETLKALMAYVASDYLPELEAHVAFANEWLAARPDLEAGTNGLEDPAARAIGKAAFELHGHVFESMVMPYRFYLLERLQKAYGEAASGDRADIQALFEETGLAPMLSLRTTRPVERRNHLEVWGQVRPSA